MIVPYIFVKGYTKNEFFKIIKDDNTEILKNWNIEDKKGGQIESKNQNAMRRIGNSRVNNTML